MPLNKGSAAFVIPAKAGIQELLLFKPAVHPKELPRGYPLWVPAFAGTTELRLEAEAKVG